MANVVVRRSRGNDIFKEIAERKMKERELEGRERTNRMARLIEMAQVIGKDDPRQAMEMLRKAASENPEEFMAAAGISQNNLSVSPTETQLAEDSISRRQRSEVEDPDSYLGNLLVTGSKMAEGPQMADYGRQAYGDEAGRKAFDLQTGAVMKAVDSARVAEERRSNQVQEQQGWLTSRSRARYYDTGSGVNQERATNLQQERDPESGLTKAKIAVKMAGELPPAVKQMKDEYDKAHATYMMYSRLAAQEDDPKLRAVVNQIAPVLKDQSRRLQAAMKGLGIEPPRNVVDINASSDDEEMEDIGDQDPEAIPDEQLINRYRR